MYLLWISVPMHLIGASLFIKRCRLERAEYLTFTNKTKQTNKQTNKQMNKIERTNWQGFVVDVLTLNIGTDASNRCLLVHQVVPSWARRLPEDNNQTLERTNWQGFVKDVLTLNIGTDASNRCLAVHQALSTWSRWWRWNLNNELQGRELPHTPPLQWRNEEHEELLEVGLRRALRKYLSHFQISSSR